MKKTSKISVMCMSIRRLIVIFVIFHVVYIFSCFQRFFFPFLQSALLFNRRVVHFSCFRAVLEFFESGRRSGRVKTRSRVFVTPTNINVLESSRELKWLENGIVLIMEEGVLVPKLSCVRLEYRKNMFTLVRAC